MREEELIEHLKNYITPERFALFEEKVQERTKHITIVLENIFQARNISASLRSADCFGIQDVHIIENTNSFKDDNEVSIGSSKWLNINRYNKKENNTKEAILNMKKLGYTIIATTPHKSDTSLFEINLDKKVAMIFGAEMEGCSREALNLSDHKMKIPMYGFTESFNISVSVALCLQHLTYQLRKSNIEFKLSEKEKNKTILKWLKNTIKSSDKIEERFFKK